MFGDSANTDVGKIEGRTLVNAKFGYEANDWSAFLYSRNLTDQNYATQYSVKSGVRKFAKTGEPRFIGLQVNMDF